ncbi:hypothetical protein PO909_026611 [Leuciscus waleckii]
MTNMNTKVNRLITNDDLRKANELNDFYLRFDTQNCVLECREALDSLVIENTSDRIIVDQQKVCSIFSRLCTKKSTGPDGISALLLKSCAEELTVAWCPIFQQSRPGRSTEDAVNTVTYFITKHLENPKAYARLLFVDFSSAFNTVQPHRLIQKLKMFNVNSFLIKWYLSFLTNRTQQVRVNHTLSELKHISIGVPQGCVSSPILFTLYTNECSSCDHNNFIVKFSDDTAILSLLHEKNDLSVYFSVISRFAEWCDLNHLIFNIEKTEEMIFDLRSIAGEGKREYLGIYVDNTLSWGIHVDTICSCMQQRLYFLRRLRLYGVDQKIMWLFYSAVIESIVRYGITVWFGNLTIQVKSKLARLVRIAVKTIGRKEILSLESLYEQSVLREAHKIVVDPLHVLYTEYELLPSGRRYRFPMCRYNRFKKSFIPFSIKLLNDE